MSSYVSYQLSKYKQAQKSTGALTRGAYDHHIVPAPAAMGMPLKARSRLPKVKTDTERSKLVELGLSQTLATLAMPYLSFRPRTSDADAQGIQTIVKAIQGHFGLPRTGRLDARTGSYLRRVAGQDWFDMNWSSLLAHTLAAPKGSHPLSDYVAVGDLNVKGPATLLGYGLAIGALAYLFIKR